MLIVKGILTSFHILVCFVLVVVILLQAAKGGGLSGTFGGGQTQALFGARGAADALSSMTQYLAAVFFILSFTLAMLSGSGGTPESVTQKVLQESPASQLPPVEALDFSSPADAPVTSDPGEETTSQPADGE